MKRDNLRAWMRLWLGLALGAATIAACSPDEDDDEEPTAAERLCEAVVDAINGCGSATPCDQALVEDCADVASILSDPYLEAAADCIDAGGVPQQCFVDALGSLEQTEAQKAFGAKFCSDCALGIPGCEQALFGGGDSEVAIAGKIIMPFGDDLVSELADECASGLTCAATFLNCAQGVLLERAIPENTLKCLFDTLTGKIEPGMESDCSSSSSGPTSSSSGGSGSPCLDAEVCATTEICDVTTQTCSPKQCGRGMECGPDQHCLVQVPDSDAGACYPGCVPFAGSCAAGQECVDRTGEGVTGVCMNTGPGALGQPCGGHDVTTGCQPGHLCGDQGEGFECLQQCDFWGGTGSDCVDAAQRCVFRACIDVPFFDPNALGQLCGSSAVAGDFCGPAGDRLEGNCQDIGEGLRCYRLCRSAFSDCPGSETCVPFAEPSEQYGLCIVL